MCMQCEQIHWLMMCTQPDESNSDANEHNRFVLVGHLADIADCWHALVFHTYVLAYMIADMSMWAHRGRVYACAYESTPVHELVNPIVDVVAHLHVWAHMFTHATSNEWSTAHTCSLCNAHSALCAACTHDIIEKQIRIKHSSWNQIKYASRPPPNHVQPPAQTRMHIARLY